MSRRGRRVVLAIVVLLGLVIALGVLTARPTLDDARRAADARWAPLRAALEPRYAAAGQLALALADTGAARRTVARDLARGSARWRDKLRGHDIVGQVESANELEGDVARTRRLIRASARLQASQEVTAALAAVDRAAPPTAAVNGYDEAARRYERTREQTWRRIVAGLLGYEARPTFQPGPPPS